MRPTKIPVYEHRDQSRHDDLTGTIQPVADPSIVHDHDRADCNGLVWPQARVAISDRDTVRDHWWTSGLDRS